MVHKNTIPNAGFHKTGSILAEDDGKVVSKELEADKPEDERTKGYNQVRNLKPRTKYWDERVLKAISASNVRQKL